MQLYIYIYIMQFSRNAQNKVIGFERIIFPSDYRYKSLFIGPCFYPSHLSVIRFDMSIPVYVRMSFFFNRLFFILHSSTSFNEAMISYHKDTGDVKDLSRNVLA